MAKLEIKVYPDKVLRKKAASVRRVGDAERKLSRDMIETMGAANGVGLAAPQVGISKRIIVVLDVEGSGQALVFINPKILKKKGRSRVCEGCLSVPDVTSDVVRPEFVTVEALNIDGEQIKMEAGGLLARIIQHEIDHLDGILFIDRIGILKRKKLIKQLGSKVCMEL
ncbi:MAG: peptide deformylase [Candidatus Gorgyraea atricola]|nr:peptide deformylase [Candidatus Gorgyraea atricola]